MRIALLRPDVEGDAVGFEAEAMGVLQHVGRHGGLAAEFARQRPFRPDAVGEDAAKDAGAGRSAGDLLHLGDAVDGVKAHAERIGARHVALLLDGVAEGDAVCRGAGREHHLDLGERGGVEARTQRGEEREHLGRRIGLDGIEHLRVRQRLGEAQIVFTHHVEIDDEAGAVLGPLTEELADARGHWRSPHGCKAANRPVVRVVNSLPGARWGRTGERGLLTRCAALDWNGELPLRTAGNDEQASSVATPALECWQRPRKPGPSLL